jgi:hypothetical protein
MTLQLMPTAIVNVCNDSGGAARNPAMQVALPIHLAELKRPLIPRHKPTLSLCTALDQLCRLHTNRRLLTFTNRARTSIATAPPTLSP